MQRVVRLLAQQRVGPHGQRHVGAFHGNADIVEIIAVQQLYVAHGALYQRLGCHTAVLGPQLLFQRATVDADADRDVLLAANVRHGLDLLLPADVAGVDPQGVDPPLGAHQRQLVVEVDVCDQGNSDLLLDLVHRLGSVLVRNCHPDDLASGIL